MELPRSRRSLVALTWLLASACAPVPPPSRVVMPERSFSVADAKLPSGLQVLVESDPTARVVASALVVSAGGADDPPGQEGLAHLVEHLTFRAHRPGQFGLTTWLALHGVGGWNGITEMDLTSYYLVGPPDTREQMAAVGRQCQASAVLGLLGDASALDVSAQLPKDAQILR